MSKKSTRDEFRKRHDKIGKGHPAYIYAKIGNEFKCIGITHDDINRSLDGKGKTVNIRLEKNPDPKDTSPAYMHPIPDKVKTKHFGKPLQGWKLSQKDKAKADEIKKKDK